ncbi:MAG: lipoprotein signal peptidase [Flavobacteriaceae bacterium]|nr:lipoprotein signal peptidase [Flavobacteriaceae bacterium]
MSYKKALFLIFILLLVDQLSKFYIKTHFILNDGILVFDWFEILFIENEGMAWGTKLSDFFPFVSDSLAKLILTLFRIAAVTGIGYWLYLSIKQKKNKWLVIAVSLIFAGALGNIIDSVFYGVIFSDSHGQVATLFPAGGGYADLFHGKVVDMLYFPIYSGLVADWVPFIGGSHFTFFDPVFNVADVAISTGIGMLILFNNKIFK